MNIAYRLFIANDKYREDLATVMLEFGDKSILLEATTEDVEQSGTARMALYTMVTV